MKQSLGHDGPPSFPYRENLITDQPLTECPLRTILRARETNPALTEEFDRYLGTYLPLYQDGHLLVEGGISQQPARYVDYMLAIRSTERALEAKAALIRRKNDGDEGDA